MRKAARIADKFATWKRAASVVVLTVLLALAGCGASPSPSAIPLPTVTPAASSTTRTGCIGAECAGSSPTPLPATAVLTTTAPPTPPPPTPAAVVRTAVPVVSPSRAVTVSATASSTILYRADFRTWFTGEEGGQYPVRAGVDVSTGEYRLALTDPQGGYVNYRTAPEEHAFKDFRLDVDVRRVQGPDQGFYGVVFRIQSAVPGAKMIERYLLTISGDGFLTFNHIGADGTVVRVAPRTEVPVIAKGSKTNHLTIVCKGTTFTLAINGQDVGTYIGPGASGGSVGVTIGTVPSNIRPNNVEAAFSNLVLSSIP